MPFPLHPIDLAVVLIYLIGLPLFGIYFKKFVTTGDDFFLAGRSLPFWVIGISILGSNIGATDYAGGSGGAFRFGLVQASYEWIGAIPAIVVSSLLFVPYYWRAGVYTVPEYLGRRYNEPVRVIQTIAWGAFMILLLGMWFYSCGIMLKEYMGIPEYWGWIATAAFVGAYTTMGGMAATAQTDVVQVVIMFVGGIILTSLGVMAVGGWESMIAQVKATHPEHFTMLHTMNHPIYPWPAIIFGLGMVAAPAWFCCNQMMVQRVLGARSEWDAKAGMMFAAIPKMMVPILTTVPGFIVLILNPRISNPDAGYAWLVKELLPKGLEGLVFAAFITGMTSAIDSTLNATSTMFSKDVYRPYFAPHADDRHNLMVGRIMNVAFLVLGICLAPIIGKNKDGIFATAQTIVCVVQGPTFAIALLGMTSRRINQWGGLAGLCAGLVFSLATVGYFTFALKQGTPFFYMILCSFVLTSVVAVLVSLLGKPDPIDKLRGLVYGLVMKDPALQGKLQARANGGE